jgi:hypothetical protein
MRNQFWKLADRDPVQVHYAAHVPAAPLTQRQGRVSGLDGKAMVDQEPGLDQEIPSTQRFKGYGTMHLLPLGKKGLSFGQSSSSRKESSQLKETLIFREAQQARMVLNLEKSVSRKSPLINQIHQRILHNKTYRSLPPPGQGSDFPQLSSAIRSRSILDPRHFTPHSLEILTSLGGTGALDPKHLLSRRGSQERSSSSVPTRDLPRKIASFGYFPFLHERDPLWWAS